MNVGVLSIWDWVDYYNSPFANPHYYSQVAVLSKFDAIELCNPIPITHDILAKNGWEYKNSDLQYRVSVFKNDVIRIGWKEDGTLIFGYYEWPIKVNYIHQLQHILRDVGLVEYANSMRV